MNLVIIFSVLFIACTVTAMDQPITINPISAPQAYFNELDSRIEREAQGVKTACEQRSLDSTLHHLHQLSHYLKEAEERRDDFSKAYQEIQQSKKRTLAIEATPAYATLPDEECMNHILEFSLQTTKFINLFKDMTQEDLTDKNWQQINALFKGINPAKSQKKTRTDSPK